MSRSDVPASGLRHAPSIELPDAALDYRADWVYSDTADARCRADPRHALDAAGDTASTAAVAVPRLVARYGDSQAAYRYSGLQHEPLA